MGSQSSDVQSLAGESYEKVVVNYTANSDTFILMPLDKGSNSDVGVFAVAVSTL